jgi:hypothetical protein
MGEEFPVGFTSDFAALNETENDVVSTSGANNLIRRAVNFANTWDVDPMLGPLQNNGGPTLTHALDPSSPALNAGSNLLNLSTDQRGASFSRVVASIADIGAFERQTPTGPTLPGDYNRDNVVNAADYVVWRKTLNSLVEPYAGADGNGNGTVDAADLAVWKQNFGATSSAGAGSSQPPSQSDTSAETPALPPLTILAPNPLAADVSMVHDTLLSRWHNRPRTAGIRVDSIKSPAVNDSAQDAALLAVLADRDWVARPESRKGVLLTTEHDKAATNIAPIHEPTTHFHRLTSKLPTTSSLRPEIVPP